MLKMAVLYLPDGKNKRMIVFDTSGNVISEIEDRTYTAAKH
ncbi:hypothetical protein [Ruminococcus albus]|nr:hypothetical protein [Ruminococcus albus]